jgi:hypothetical protein
MRPSGTRENKQTNNLGQEFHFFSNSKKNVRGQVAPSMLAS